MTYFFVIKTYLTYLYGDYGDSEPYKLYFTKFYNTFYCIIIDMHIYVLCEFVYRVFQGAMM